MKTKRERLESASTLNGPKHAHTKLRHSKIARAVAQFHVPRLQVVSIAALGELAGGQASEL